MGGDSGQPPAKRVRMGGNGGGNRPRGGGARGGRHTQVQYWEGKVSAWRRQRQTRGGLAP